MNKLLTFILLSVGLPTSSIAYGVSTDIGSAIVHGHAVVDSTQPTTSQTLVSVYVVAEGKVETMVEGGTLQFLAYGTYSDGTVVQLPESETDPVIAWNTSNHEIAKISRLGHATAVGTGVVDVGATVGSIKATPWSVTVSKPGGPKGPSISCSANPSIVTPGDTTLITAYGTSPGNLPLSYSYQASAGSISGTSANQTLQTFVGMGGLVTVTCTVNQPGGGSASATTTVLVASSSGDLAGALNWQHVHDSATPGESQGSSVYPATAPPYENARKFYMTYSDRGGERFSISFGNSTSSTHFVYDAEVYIVDPLQLQNLEMDVNQVMADGRTVVFATQCAGTSRTWEYTTDVTVGGKRSPHWNPSNIPCNPRTWTANCWHHVQIASSRDASGNVTYDWVNLDGATSNFENASGPSALSLGWSIGDLSINFQLDGASMSSESVTAYVENLTIYRW